jgi:large subunit ribosomal protein L9
LDFKNWDLFGHWSLGFGILFMRVILLQDIDNLGKKYEVKEVKNGYARNFLIPKGIAKPATKEALIWVETQKEIETKKAEESLKKVQEIASTMEGLEVVIPVKIGEEGQLYESITAQKISERLKEVGFEIKRNQIELPEPIKELGEFPVKIKFEHNLEAEIRVIVTEEK